MRGQFLVQLLLLQARRCSACFQVEADDVAALISLAAQGSSSWSATCNTLGGLSACFSLCSSLQSDTCFDDYLKSLGSSPVFGGSTLLPFMALHQFLSHCKDADTTSTCTDSNLLAPLKPQYQRELLCDPRCSWDQLPAFAVNLVKSELAQVKLRARSVHSTVNLDGS